MPDSGLPREPCARRARERVTLAGASFGTPFWVFLGGLERTASSTRQSRMQAGFCPVRFARDMLSACRALFVCDRFAGCDSGLQLVAHD